MKRKLTLIIIGSIFISFVVLIIVNTYNTRSLGIKGAKEKASIAAELVKNGLTAHMVNGMMGTRKYFLDEIYNTPDIQSLFIVRSKSVIDQFGNGLEGEIKDDAIIQSVFKKGVSNFSVTDTANGASLRATVPYIASADGAINCMSCHNAVQGDVLGLVDITISMDDTKHNGIMMALIYLGFSIVIMLIITLIIQRSLNPVMSLFGSIEDVMGHAQKGDYAKRVINSDSSQECKNITFWVNSLLNKLQITLQEIEKTANEFLSIKIDAKKDILIELKDVVREMSELNKFKKTIQSDTSKAQIYERLGTILRSKFQIENFILLERDKANEEKMEIVYTTDPQKEYKIKPTCRALQTKQSVDSLQFEKLCQECNDSKEFYFCEPYTISDDIELLLHVSGDSEKAVTQIKKNLEVFENYITESKPEIISQNLTDILRHSSYTDQLTGLYNRKYLDEFIEKTTPQALRTRTNYGVLMVDIDYFKMVNDTYGHDIGDIALRRLSKVLKESIRESDVAFRFGGEEFIILLYNCEESKIQQIAENIRTKFEKEKIVVDKNTSFSKTLSIGISLFPKDADSFWKVIKFADIALYHAKDTGRNRVIRYDESLQTSDAQNADSF